MRHTGGEEEEEEEGPEVLEDEAELEGLAAAALEGPLQLQSTPIPF